MQRRHVHVPEARSRARKLYGLAGDVCRAGLGLGLERQAFAETECTRITRELGGIEMLERELSKHRIDGVAERTRQRNARRVELGIVGEFAPRELTCSAVVANIAFGPEALIEQG